MVESKPPMRAPKFEIKQIEDKKARLVCFSKRRASLFNKAHELSILCGAMIAIVVLSPGGKVFSFGHPSVNSVINRFFTGSAPDHPITSNTSQGEDDTATNIRKLVRQQSKLKRWLEARMRCKKLLKEELAMASGGRVMNGLLSGHDKMGLEELEAYHKELTAMHVTINERIKQLSKDDDMQAHVAPMT